MRSLLGAIEPVELLNLMEALDNRVRTQGSNGPQNVTQPTMDQPSEFEG